MLFFHSVRMKGPTPLRHSCVCWILLALDKGNFHNYSRTFEKTLSIQYFNVSYHLATDLHRMCILHTQCILFPADDVAGVDDEPAGFVSDHFRSRTTWRCFPSYAPYVTHLFACILWSTPLPFWSVIHVSFIKCRLSCARNTCEHACSVLSIFDERVRAIHFFNFK